MNWKKYIVISISAIGALFLTRQIIQACGDFNFYDTYPQFFGNETPNKPAYMPFNFIDNELYYEDGYWDGNQYRSITDSVNKAFILNEWKDFTDGKSSIKDIEALLYKGGATTFVKLKNSKAVAPQNSFADFLSEKKNRKVLDYLIYAKKCEQNAQENLEDWKPENLPQQTYSNATLKEEGLKAIRKAKNSFIEMKYAFQILRLAFYSQQYEEVLDLYNSLLKNKTDNSVAFTRCIGFRAGAYYRLGDRVKAGYYYTKMFDNSDAYKKAAMISFQWSVYEDNKDNFEAIYALCQNPHEQAVTLSMNTLRDYAPALDNLEKIYALDPKAPGIEVLVNREINKLEKLYFSQKIYSENQLDYPYRDRWYYRYQETSAHKSDSLDRKYKPYVQQLTNFIDQLQNDNKTGTPALWHLCKAYMDGMMHKPEAMNQELAQARQSNMNANEQTTFHVIELLYTLYKSPKITRETEKEILPKLQALNNLANHNYLANYQFRDIMRYLIAGKYFQQGDSIRGIYAMAHATSWKVNGIRKFFVDEDFQDRQGNVLNNMSIANLQKVIDFRESANKTPFEQWLTSETYYTPETLEDLKAVKYLRNQNYEAASKIFAQTETGARFFPDPFMPQINDYLELEAKDTSLTFTKLTFSRRMAELKEIIHKNPNDAGALYGYAVALYNISYYGKAAYITNYARHSTDEFGYFKSKEDDHFPDYLKEYYRVYTAEKYFRKAADAANNPELKAKALWGAAKCWNKRCPYIDEPKGYISQNAYTDYYLNSLRSPYFETLSTNYAETKFIQRVRTTCEYYSDYLMQKY